MCNFRAGAIPPRANPHPMRLREIDRARIADVSTDAGDDRVKIWRISRADRASASDGSRSSTGRGRRLRAFSKFPEKKTTSWTALVPRSIVRNRREAGSSQREGGPPAWAHIQDTCPHLRPLAASTPRRGLTAPGAGVISGGPQFGAWCRGLRTPISEVSREEDVPTPSQEPQAHPRIP